MFGCCGYIGKLRDSEGVVDSNRIDEIVSEKKREGWSELEIADIAECTCPCHVDGITCVC